MRRLRSSARAIVRENGYSSLVTRAIKFVMWTAFGRLLFLVATRRLKSQAGEMETVEIAVRAAFEFRFLGLSIVPSQIEEEILEFLKSVKDLKPETVVEIGTARGGTLFLFSRVASPDAILLSIDLPEGPFGGGSPERMNPWFRSFACRGQSVHLIRADSHSLETLNEAHKILVGRPVDLLFIDGDHTYEGVRKDFEMYSPLVRKGGIIAFHDVCPGSSVNVGGVPSFWREVSAHRACRTVVKDHGQDGYGIGVLIK